MAGGELVPQLAAVDDRPVEDVSDQLHPPLRAAEHQPVALARVLLGHQRDHPIDVRERVPRADEQQVGARLPVEVVHRVDRFDHGVPRDGVPDPIGLQERGQRHARLGRRERLLDRAGRRPGRQRRPTARELRERRSQIRVRALAHRRGDIRVVLDARLGHLVGESLEHERHQFVLALLERSND